MVWKVQGPAPSGGEGIARDRPGSSRADRGRRDKGSPSGAGIRRRGPGLPCCWRPARAAPRHRPAHAALCHDPAAIATVMATPISAPSRRRVRDLIMRNYSRGGGRFSLLGLASWFVLRSVRVGVQGSRFEVRGSKFEVRGSTLTVPVRLPSRSGRVAMRRSRASGVAEGFG